MKKGFVFFIALFCGFSFSLFAKENTNNNASLFFQENKGQVTDQNHLLRNDILFYGTTQDLGFFVKKNGVSYQLYKAADTSKTSPSVTIQRVDISWTGANENATIIKENPAASVNNYYNVEVPALNVKSYEQFRFQDLYNGIDLKYYQQNGSLKYDYIIHPHANYHQIQLHVEGAELTLEQDGTIQIKTPLGTITEGQPTATQNGRQVAVNWVLNNNTLSFQIPEYNPNEELVIDPLVFVGNSNVYSVPQLGKMFLQGAVYDHHGNSFKYGYYSTASIDPYDYNGFISKYNSLDTLIFTKKIVGNSTWGGGLIYTIVKSAGVDDFDNVYYTGTTNVMNNITTTGAYQTIFQGGHDGFLIKIDSIGTIIWATYFGGNSDEYINSSSVDKKGNNYLVGSTASAQLIATPISFQPSKGGGSYDGFISKFNADGQRIWSTYYGGNAIDYANSIALDTSTYHLFICGSSNSTNGIATTGAFKTTHTGYHLAGYIVDFDTLGNRIWGTYYGNDSTTADCIVSDNHGTAYFVGQTLDTSGIATNNVFQNTLWGNVDGYLAKINDTGFRVWGTYDGGGNWDYLSSCDIDSMNHIIVSGGTFSLDSRLVTPGAYQTIFTSGYQSGLFQEFDSTGNKTWGTFIYSFYIAFIDKCFFDNNNIAYVCGKFRDGFNIQIFTPYAYKFAPYQVATPIISNFPYKLCLNDSMKLSATHVNGAHYEWYYYQTLIPFSDTSSIKIGSSGIYTVKIIHNGTYAISQPLTVIDNSPIFTSSTIINVSCGDKNDGSFIILSSGGTPPYQYTVNGSPKPQLNDSLFAGNYNIHTTDSSGCSNNFVAIVGGPSIIQTNAVVGNQPCYSKPAGWIHINVSGGIPPYQYAWNNLQDTTPTITLLQPNTYTVTIIDSINCTTSLSFEVQKDYSPMPTNPLVSICAVTVDSFENKNRIVWEKGGNSHASAYNIYRESTVAEQYDLIGTQASDKYTAYLDSNANPLQQSYRYKITETDSCGNEFSKSAYHQTIHLSASSGINGEVNLSWNLYEGVGFNTQYIKRSINGNAFVSIAQVASTTNSYTDANPPAGQKDYRIDIDLPIGCVYNSFHQITSNAITFNPNGSTVHIFPNPTADLLNIRGTIPSKILLEDLAGKKVVEEGKTNELSIHYLATGMYLIKLFDNNGNCYFRSKIVKH